MTTTIPSDFEFPELSLDDMAFMLEGACVGMSTKLFFPENGKRVPQEARDACDRCDVHEACLDWALRFEDYGFWASTTADERARMRRAAA